MTGGQGAGPGLWMWNGGHLYRLAANTGTNVETGIQEDVDVIGLASFWGPYHLFLGHGAVGKGAEDILVIGGGIIPEDDIPALKEAGIAEIFTPGTTTQAVIEYIKERAQQS